METQVEDESVARVQGLVGKLNLVDTDALGGTLDVEKTRLVLLRLNLVEAGVDSAVHNANAGRSEVRSKCLALESINLTVLNRGATEKVVKLYGLVSLVERGMLTQMSLGF
jgi:hypothetical protein